MSDSNNPTAEFMTRGTVEVTEYQLVTTPHRSYILFREVNGEVFPAFYEEVIRVNGDPVRANLIQELRGFEEAKEDSKLSLPR